MASDHPRDERQRSIADPHCADPNCEFYGKPWQQGVCFSSDLSGDRDVDRRIAKMSRRGKQVLDEIHDLRRTEFDGKPEEYICWLEAMYETGMMNWDGCLDECIALRVENRRLKELLNASADYLVKEKLAALVDAVNTQADELLKVKAMLAKATNNGG